VNTGCREFGSCHDRKKYRDKIWTHRKSPKRGRQWSEKKKNSGEWCSQVPSRTIRQTGGGETNWEVLKKKKRNTNGNKGEKKWHRVGLGKKFWGLQRGDRGGGNEKTMKTGLVNLGQHSKNGSKKNRCHSSRSTKKGFPRLKRNNPVLTLQKELFAGGGEKHYSGEEL